MKAILNDLTRCIGCQECVRACKEHNHLPPDRPWPWLKRIDDLSTARWTTIRRLATPQGERYLRRMCHHCLEPECVSVCIVGALEKTPQGPVIYHKDICIGCRYCMIACPWTIPRYSWEEAVPFVQKCDMCHSRVASGKGIPACVEACPVAATEYGERETLLAEARRRLRTEPRRYRQRIWGEKEVGGTSVLFIGDTELHLTDLKPEIEERDPLPERTTRILHKTPWLFTAMGCLMGAAWWFVHRRRRVQEEEGDHAG